MQVFKILAAAAFVVLLATPVRAGDVNINLHLGPPPVPILVPEPPLFLVPPQLGFQVAVDLPYDMIHIDGRYYVFRDGAWYVGPHYNGPWRGIAHEHLPPGLRKHRIVTIREYREGEHRKYKKEKEHYRGHKFRPADKEDPKAHGGKGRKGKHD